jgi:hypothetical protein
MGFDKLTARGRPSVRALSARSGRLPLLGVGFRQSTCKDRDASRLGDNPGKTRVDEEGGVRRRKRVVLVVLRLRRG